MASVVLTTGLAALAGCSGPHESQARRDAGGSHDSGPAPAVYDGGGVVEPPPDGAAACASATCNYQTDDGCSGGETCRPSVTATAVVPSCHTAGSTGRGGACKDWSDCAAGLLCAEGVCRKLCCDRDWSACPDGESCFRPILVKVNDQPTPSGASLCYPADQCDPLDESSCPAGEACQPVDSRGGVACRPAGRGGAREPCPCAAGFFCIGQLGMETCRRFCDADPAPGSVACPSGEGVCVRFRRDPPGVGECATAPGP